MSQERSIEPRVGDLYESKGPGKYIDLHSVFIVTGHDDCGNYIVHDVYRRTGRAHDPCVGPTNFVRDKYTLLQRGDPV